MKYKLKLHYTSDELKELRELRENNDSPMYATCQIADTVYGSDKFKNLHMKYAAIDYADEFDFMADINNVVMGTASFPEKKYVVHDKVTDQYVYYSFPWKGLRWGSLQLGTGAETKAKEEWLAINPAYEPMLERVKD